jgi:SAM-dependent methyltransferase
VIFIFFNNEIIGGNDTKVLSYSPFTDIDTKDPKFFNMKKLLTIYNKCKDKNLKNIMLDGLKSMVNKTVGVSITDVDDIIHLNEQDHLNDISAYEYFNSKKKIIANSFDRGGNRANFIINHLNNKRVLSKLIRPKVLDFGCGTGDTTHSLFQELKCSDGYGVDIYETNRSIKFVLEKFGSNDPFENLKKKIGPNYKFDFILCNMSLHHQNPDLLDTTIAGIKSLLAPSGIIMLIEHNIPNEYQKLLVNLEHIFYTIKNEEYKNNTSYTSGELLYPLLATQWVEKFKMQSDIFYKKDYKSNNVPYGGQTYILLGNNLNKQMNGVYIRRK